MMLVQTVSNPRPIYTSLARVSRQAGRADAIDRARIHFLQAEGTEPGGACD